MKEEHHFK